MVIASFVLTKFLLATFLIGAALPVGFNVTAWAAENGKCMIFFKSYQTIEIIWNNYHNHLETKEQFLLVSVRT